MTLPISIVVEATRSGTAPDRRHFLLAVSSIAFLAILTGRLRRQQSRQGELTGTSRSAFDATQPQLSWKPPISWH